MHGYIKTECPSPPNSIHDPGANSPNFTKELSLERFWLHKKSRYELFITFARDKDVR